MTKAVNIGEVLNRLKPEFEDITMSKIRFLETKGLIQPDRTEGGYRKFTPEDVERLRYILRAQRDRYLPLDVIKDELDRMDTGQLSQGQAVVGSGSVSAGSPPSPGGPVGHKPPGALRLVPSPEQTRGVLDRSPLEARLTAGDLAMATGLMPNDVDELRDAGILSSGDPVFDADDLAIAHAAQALVDAGLEPRHLKIYLRFTDNEVAQHAQRVRGSLRSRRPDALDEAQEEMERVVLAASELHRLLLVRSVRALLDE